MEDGLEKKRNKEKTKNETKNVIKVLTPHYLFIVFITVI